MIPQFYMAQFCYILVKRDRLICKFLKKAKTHEERLLLLGHLNELSHIEEELKRLE